MSDRDTVQKQLVDDVLRIASILNKHLSELDCKHNVKQIAREAFGYE